LEYISRAARRAEEEVRSSDRSAEKQLTFSIRIETEGILSESENDE
jgi:hypothetical protein